MKIPFYFKIIIAFILGISFGFLFQNKKNLIINYESQNIEISEIEYFFLCNKYCIKIDEKEFKKDINKSLNKIKDSSYIKVIYKNNEYTFETEKIKSIKTSFNIYDILEIFGKIFIKVLQMISIPLVISSLIFGVGNIGDIKKLKNMAIFTILFYISSTILAIVTGLILVNHFKPGSYSKNTVLLNNFNQSKNLNTGIDLKNFIIDIIPQNPFRSIVEGNMLQIIFFSVLIGIFLNIIKDEKAKVLLTLTETISEIMIKNVILIMKFAPIAVFSLIACVISEAGIELMKSMLYYMLIVIVGLILYLFVFYSVYLKLLSKTKIKDFFKGIRDVIMVAFSTSSSAAALPVNFECCEQNLKVPKQITSFVLPLGATINMNGTAMYQAIAAVFIAQIYGIELSLFQQITIVIMAVAAAIGSSPVPGVGIIMLVIILNSVGIPTEGIAIIIGVDRILDMFRTVVNVVGDSVACVIIKDKINND